jgi:hypothetical protein
MREAVLISAALLLAGPPAARAAEPSLFEAYKALCVKTRSDPAKVRAALGPEWTPLKPPTGPHAPLGWARQVGGDVWKLSVGETPMPTGWSDNPYPARMRLCMLTTVRPGSGIGAAMRRSFGRVPSSTKLGYSSWTYIDAPAGRRFLPDHSRGGIWSSVALAPFVLEQAGESQKGDLASWMEIRRAEP